MPTENRCTMSNSNILEIASFETPLGTMTAGYTSAGLAVLSFCTADDLTVPASLQSFEHVSANNTERVQSLEKQLSAYFLGDLTDFDVTLDLHGTDFQQSVWDALLHIPYGRTRSYKEQSEFLGNVKAIRAVAAANGANPVAIIVPCHRVIGSNNSLTGYAGELWRKQRLLEIESNQTQLF